MRGRKALPARVAVARPRGADDHRGARADAFRLPVAALLLALGSAGACGPADERAAERAGRAASDDAGAPAVRVRPGLDVLVSDSAHLVRGRRMGLITNRSGVSRDGRSGIDVLAALDDAELVTLFSPEHGIRGTAPEGEAIEDEVDAATGLPVRSLYGGTRTPTPEALAGLDVLLFDLQDIGARYYTYVSTMAYAMRAAGESGVPFVVLDRPNPIDGLVQGPVLEPAFATFVGLYPVPARHGMTAGELARLYAGEFGIEVELHVVPADGWRRDVWFDGTGLPWIPPSRNMPTLESATHYPGTCLFEGTNLSVGRGTPAAFRQIGAPWLEADSLAARLEARGLAGVRIEAVAFTPVRPTDGKYDGETVRGIRFTVTDRDVYDPVRTAVAALRDARDLAGSRWRWNPPHFDRLAGSDALRLAIEAGGDPAAIAASWEPELEAFRRLRAPYLIYGDAGRADR